MTAYRKGEHIIALVAKEFGVRAREIMGRSRRKQVALARAVAMALCREHAGLSYPEIGWLFGKHHTTAIHAVRRTRGMDVLAYVRRELAESEVLR